LAVIHNRKMFLMIKENNRQENKLNVAGMRMLHYMKAQTTLIVQDRIRNRYIREEVRAVFFKRW